MLRSAIDALFAGGREHAQARPSQAAPTIAQVYLAAMRAHQRQAALLDWAEQGWQATPDWRLDRNVIRIGLYLRERMGINPADRIAIVAPVCRDWAVAELACLVQGAVVVAVDPFLPNEALESALARLSPRVVFAADQPVLARLQARRAKLPNLRTIIAFEATQVGADLLLGEVLDQGGTLDTPERAQAFRARAKEVKPEAEALGFFDRRWAGYNFLTHQDVAARIEQMWLADPAMPGDVTYLAHGPVSQGALVALLAAIGDGLSAAAFGTAGSEAAEIAALSPHRIVASGRVLQSALATANGSRTAPSLLQRATGLAGLATRRRRREATQSVLGHRARWVHPVIEDGGDAAALAPLGEFVSLDVQSEV